MRRILAVLLVCFFCAPLLAQSDRDKTIDRLSDAGTILKEIMSAPDAGIPDDILGSAKCVAVVPSYLKAAFGFGAHYGKGVASCRTDNGWSAPAFIRIEGGSFGLQIGGQAVDYVMLFMNDNGMRNLLSSKFKVGADASAAAGPVGRQAEGSTDWKMRAEILTYSRARGVFAGVSLSGNVVKQDRDDTRAFYGRMVPFRTALTGLIAPPSEAQPFLAGLQQYAPVKVAEGPKSAAEKK